MVFFRSLVFVSGLGVLNALASAQYDPYFQWLGDFPGGDNYSNAWGASSNGVYATGESSGSAGYTSFRWSMANGFQNFGEPNGGFVAGSGFDVSNTGLIVGGGFSSSGYEAFRTNGTTLTTMGDFSGGEFNSVAKGVSDDGTVIVGYGTTSANREPFRWTQSTGMVSIGSLPGGTTYGEALAVSGDGSTIVGKSTATEGTGAFRWTQGGGMVSLGTLPGATFGGEAFGVNGDGSVIVGQARTTNGVTEAFKWTASGGMVGLGDLPFGGFQSYALGVSADGSVIVGWGSGELGAEAFMYDPVNGMVNLSQLLTARGLGSAFAGYTLREATAVHLTAYGVPVIYGYATNGSVTRAFVTAVPEPGSVTAVILGTAFFLRRKKRSKA